MAIILLILFNFLYLLINSKTYDRASRGTYEYEGPAVG